MAAVPIFLLLTRIAVADANARYECTDGQEKLVGFETIIMTVGSTAQGLGLAIRFLRIPSPIKYAARYETRMHMPHFLVLGKIKAESPIQTQNCPLFPTKLLNTLTITSSRKGVLKLWIK